MTILATTIKRGLAAAVLCGALGLAGTAKAAEPGVPNHFMTMSEDFVRSAMRVARSQLDSAENPAPELPFNDAREIVNSGAASGFASWCKLDWQNRIFLPMMRFQRMAHARPPQVMKYAALLHGVAQRIVSRDLQARTGDCRTEDKAAIQAYLTHALTGK